MISPAVAACLLGAAVTYHLPIPALQAIVSVEGGTIGVANCDNTNGSCDLGPFQVNDRAWVKRLADRLNAEPEKVRDTLRDDPCWNTDVAAWILRTEVDAAKGDLSVGIGNYHSHTPAEHMRYRALVAAALERLYPTSGSLVADQLQQALPQPAALNPAEPGPGFKTPVQAIPPPSAVVTRISGTPTRQKQLPPGATVTKIGSQGLRRLREAEK